MADPQAANNTQIVTIGQNMVVAINALNNTINTRFPNWVAAPANSTASGVAGQVAYDSTHFYVAVSSNAWLRFNGSATF